MLGILSVVIYLVLIVRIFSSSSQEPESYINKNNIKRYIPTYTTKQINTKPKRKPVRRTVICDNSEESLW